MKLSLSEAARRAGVGRQTLYRRISQGKLSREIGADGQPVIDLSELARLYPAAIGERTGRDTGRDVSSDNSGQGSETGADTLADHAGVVAAAELAALRERVRTLEADKADLSAKLDKALDTLQAQTRLLTDQRPSESRPSWWRRLRGSR